MLEHIRKRWLYFALINDAQIKIGTTHNVAQRMKEHASGGQVNKPNTIVLLAAVEGNDNDEKQIHRFFVKDRTPEHKEMYYPTEHLTNYIRWLRKQWYVSTKEEINPEDCIPYNVWAPTEDTERQTYPSHLPLWKAAAVKPNWLDFPEHVMTPDDYWTKDIVLKCTRKVLGKIDLDPASCADANRRVKAAKFYNKPENGLLQQWAGRVWLNPPFSDYRSFVSKIRDEWETGRITAMCVYCASRTLTAKYFRPFLDITNAMCIITGRLGHDGLGDLGSSPQDGNCVFYIGPDVNLFAKTFAELGKVYVVTT